MLPSVLPPRTHGLLSETRNEGLSRLPFLLTQVLVRNCSTRYEFPTNGSRWEPRTAVPGIFCPPVSIHACILIVHACMHFVRVHYDSPISALLKRRSHPVGRITSLTGFPLFPLLQRTLWTSEDMLRITRNLLLLGIKPVFYRELHWLNFKFQLQ